MFKSRFFGSVIVLVLGVNLSAWALWVGTTPGSHEALAPITPEALDNESLAAASDAAVAPSDPTKATSSTTSSPSNLPQTPVPPSSPAHPDITLIQD